VPKTLATRRPKGAIEQGLNLVLIHRPVVCTFISYPLITIGLNDLQCPNAIKNGGFEAATKDWIASAGVEIIKDPAQAKSGTDAG
jgi:hypothetical protein